jgi:membrane-associated phospholipid phosphatase
MRRNLDVLVIGLAVGAALIYAAMWIGWTAPWGWVVDVDSATLASAHRLGVESRVWTDSWNALCTVFSPFVLRVVTFAVGVLALLRARYRAALFLLVVAVLSGLLTQFAKWLGDRPRPGTALVRESGTSFPSGHALGVMACVLALAVVVLPLVRARLRPWLGVVGALIVLGVGVGRVALNVHHASDVVAGWALGYVWFALWLLVIRPDARGVTAADGTPGVRGTAR